jgi:hypothetical protein
VVAGGNVRSFLPSDFEGDLSFEEVLGRSGVDGGEGSGTDELPPINRPLPQRLQLDGGNSSSTNSNSLRGGLPPFPTSSRQGADAAALALLGGMGGGGLLPQLGARGAEDNSSSNNTSADPLQPQLPTPSSLPVDLLNSGGELGDGADSSRRSDAHRNTKGVTAAAKPERGTSQLDVDLAEQQAELVSVADGQRSA